MRIRSVRRDVLVWMELGYELGCFSEFLSLELWMSGQVGSLCIVRCVLMILSLRENGADFYGLPRNEGYVELREEEWR